MKLGRVIGTVVATTLYEGLEGVRLLVVQPLNNSLEPDGTEIIMCDAIQSGPGDVIFWVGSREASLGLDNTFVPVDATVVGFVDAVGRDNVDVEFSDRG